VLEPFFGEFLFTNVDVEGLMQGIDRDAIAPSATRPRGPSPPRGGVTTQDGGGLAGVDRGGRRRRDGDLHRTAENLTAA
jgi:hypothetical protein